MQRRTEELKSKIALDREKRKEKPSFLLILHDTASVKRAFEDHPENFSITKKIKEKAEQLTENIKEKSEVISETIKEKSEGISEGIKEKSAIISEGLKTVSAETKDRLSETLSRNDSSDVADTDLFAILQTRKTSI